MLDIYCERNTSAYHVARSLIFICRAQIYHHSSRAVARTSQPRLTPVEDDDLLDSSQQTPCYVLRTQGSELEIAHKACCLKNFAVQVGKLDTLAGRLTSHCGRCTVEEPKKFTRLDTQRFHDSRSFWWSIGRLYLSCERMVSSAPLSLTITRAGWYESQSFFVSAAYGSGLVFAYQLQRSTKD